MESIDIDAPTGETLKVGDGYFSGSKKIYNASFSGDFDGDVHLGSSSEKQLVRCISVKRRKRAKQQKRSRRINRRKKK